MTSLIPKVGNFRAYNYFLSFKLFLYSFDMNPNYLRVI